MLDRVRLGVLDDSLDDPVPTGHVIRDDRGNAVWEWLLDEDDAIGLQRRLPLADTIAITPVARGPVELSLAAEAPGYNPYDRGRIEPPARPDKRDLRQLSRWIEQRRVRAPRPVTGGGARPHRAQTASIQRSLPASPSR